MKQSSDSSYFFLPPQIPRLAGAGLEVEKRWKKGRRWEEMKKLKEYDSIYVSVWNCRASWVIGDVDESELTEKQKEALDELANYVIYTVNDGAINISGQYQLDDRSYEILMKILEAKSDEEVEEAISLIKEPSDEDFRKTAERLLEELKNSEDGHYMLVYDSGLNCWLGCQGYHSRNYVAKLDGKIVLVHNGEAHHALVVGMRPRILREIDEEEAFEKIVDFLKALAEKYNYTKAELNDYMLDSKFEDARLQYCEKHDEIHFDYEDCPTCLKEVILA